MPQMMPINWMISFLFFINIFIIFIMMNYYIFNIKTSSNNMLMKKSINNLNWKW